MNLEQASYLAEIIGVVLVVASLIYVARQLRQNTDAIRAQSRQAVLTAAQAELFAEMENPDIVTSIVKAGALSQEEHIKLAAWLFAVLRVRQFSWLQHRNGAIDDSQWNTEVSVIRFIFDSKKTRDWWTKIGHLAFGDEFSEFINSEIRDHLPTEKAWQSVANWTDP